MQNGKSIDIVDVSELSKFLREFTQLNNDVLVMLHDDERDKDQSQRFKPKLD